MIDLTTCNEWQRRDPENGLVMPWYTHPFLDELATWDLKEKVVLEIGMGASSIWWNNKVEWLTAIDTNQEWYYTVIDKLDFSKGTSYLPIEGKLIDAMVNLLDLSTYDIAVIDCDPVEYRDKCAQAALLYLKPGGKLIIDNWDQPSVWVPNEETRKLLAPYDCKIYKQPNHPDWQTAVFTIGKSYDNISITEVSALPNGQHGIGFTAH